MIATLEQVKPKEQDQARAWLAQLPAILSSIPQGKRLDFAMNLLECLDRAGLDYTSFGDHMAEAIALRARLGEWVYD